MKKFFTFSQVMLALCIVCSCSESSDEARHSNAQLMVNGHKFVDLGLPSGLLWAETNVGASSASEDGDYFAWGETEPKAEYTWDNYKWSRGETDYRIDLIKYNFSDGKITLHARDDAATVNWGAPCRMPSSSDFEELFNQCDWSWQSNGDGTSGILFIGPNGNTIFLPASGRWGTDSDHGVYGYYWSRSLCSSVEYRQDKIWAYYLYFGSDEVGDADNRSRSNGFSVRPVVEK